MRPRLNELPIRVLSLPGRRYPNNPYMGLFCDALEQEGMTIVEPRSLAALWFKFDILHLHFPEHFVTERSLGAAILNSSAFALFSSIAVVLGKKLIWTVHEVVPRPRHVWLLRPYHWYIRRLIGGYAIMSEESGRRFFELFPRERNKVVCKVPHGPYKVDHISASRRLELRRSLVEDDACLLVGYLGEIKNYKNPRILINVPARDDRGRVIKLVVAGNVHPECDATEIQAVFDQVGAERIVRIGDRVSHERLAELIQSVDIVLLPYLLGWNSGVATLVLSCRTRLLCSTLPMFEELFRQLGRPWIDLFDHRSADVAAELRAALGRVVRGDAQAEQLDRFLAAISFGSGARTLEAVYRRLLGKTASAEATTCT